MAAVFSVVGAVVGEFIGAQAGLGTLIMSMNSQMDVAGTFSVLVVLSIIGIALHSTIRIVRKRLPLVNSRQFGDNSGISRI